MVFKLSNEDKLSMVFEHLEQVVILYELAKSYDISNVKYFDGFYHMYGKDVFLHRG
jgi:hypothetical protein